MHWIFFVLFLTTFLWDCESAKILAIFPVPGRSHYYINSKVITELVKRGHHVTLYTPFLRDTPLENLKEIYMPNVVARIEEEKKNMYAMASETLFANSHFYFRIGYVVTEATLENEDIQKLLHSDEKFDLVMMPQFVLDGLAGIAEHFKAPLIGIGTMPLFPWTNFVLSHPTPPSYVPNLFSPYTGHMNFWQRLVNSFLDAYTILYHQLVMLPKHRELVMKYIPGDLDLYDFVSNVSLVLINSHISTNEAMPHVPNAIEIGGIHIEEPKKLPQDLQMFLDESVNGVIVFSLGSNLKSSELPLEKQNAILKAFSKLKQNVLWKWETDSLPGQPKNVKLMKWLPQSDVLAHPNVKACITHGGLLSAMEAIYHGIPIIGIPFFGDQRMNMATAVAYEYGIEVPFVELTEEKLTRALNEILNNPKYHNVVKNRSKIMRDRPMKPVDTAMYWVEYVIRHQGAPHLRYPGMDLFWYQRALLDVVAFVLLVASVVIYTIVAVCKKITKRNVKYRNAKKEN